VSGLIVGDMTDPTNLVKTDSNTILGSKFKLNSSLQNNSVRWGLCSLISSN